ncbi:MAG: hypothetical protein ABII23_06265 [bacterium]
MKKFVLGMLLFSSICAAQEPVNVSRVKGYRLQLLSLDYFDYNKRFKGRQTLGSQGEIPCLRGSIFFETALDDIPTAINPTCIITEAQTNAGISLVIKEEEDDFKEHVSNIGRLVFYIDTPGKKDMMLTSLKGEALFKAPVRQNIEKIDTLYQCHWFKIFGGQAAMIVCDEDQAHEIYIILKYPKKNLHIAKLLRLYLFDIATEEKNILWHYTSFTDSLGDQTLVYKTSFYFESKENIYITINDKDYQVSKIIGPPFPNAKDINVFNIKNYKGTKYSKQLYMIMLPESRPQKYNWALLNFGEKRSRFSRKMKKGSALEKRLVIFKEFTGIPNTYNVQYISLFQSDKFIKKAVPFSFKNIPLTEEKEEEVELEEP